MPRKSPKDHLKYGAECQTPGWHILGKSLWTSRVPQGKDGDACFCITKTWPGIFLFIRTIVEETRGGSDWVCWPSEYLSAVGKSNVVLGVDNAWCPVKRFQSVRKLVYATENLSLSLTEAGVQSHKEKSKNLVICLPITWKVPFKHQGT